MNDQTYRILIVIPAYNESKNIRVVLNGITKVIPNADILVIDDGSTDETANIAQAAGAKVIVHPYNMGYGVASQTGFKYAYRHGYDYVVQMDADGQHEPSSIPSILNALIHTDVDVVLGSRWLDINGFHGPILRKFGKFFFSFLARILTNLKITDPTTGFQGLNKKVVKLYCTDIYPVDYPDADMIILLNRAGFKVVEVPVTMHRAINSKSMHRGFVRPIYYGIKMMMSMMMMLLRKDRDKIK